MSFICSDSFSEIGITLEKEHAEGSDQWPLSDSRATQFECNCQSIK